VLGAESLGKVAWARERLPPRQLERTPHGCLTCTDAGNDDHMAERKKRTASRWSQDVTEHSNALDLDGGVFTWEDPKRIAASLKQSAETSKRRKADAFRSALSMLVFYQNRAGKNLTRERRKVLDEAKDELRELFGRGRKNARRTTA